MRFRYQMRAVNAHQVIFVQINDRFLELRVNWRTYTEEWVVDAYEEGEIVMAGVSFKTRL